MDKSRIEVRRVLIDDIRRAFAHVVRGDGVTLHEAVAMDDYRTESEQQAARNLDTDQHWWEVSDDLIERDSAVFSFFDPEGFRYYLPAYMSWALRLDDLTTTDTYNFITYALVPSTNLGRLERRFVEKREHDIFESFTADQAHAICRFLRFMADTNGIADELMAEQALSRYWGRFCG